MPVKVSLSSKATILAGFAVSGCGLVLSACLPQMRAAFSRVPYSAFWVKSLMAIPPLFSGISALFVGTLADKWGRKPTLILVLSLSIAGCVGFFVESLRWIVASRVFVGVGLGGATSVFLVLIGDYFKKGREQNRFIGFQGACLLLGYVVFTLLGGFLAVVNWRLAFLSYLAPAVLLICVLTFIEEPKKVVVPKETFPKSLIPVFILAFGAGIVNCLIYIYAPFYLGSMGGDSMEFGFALSSVLVAGAISAVCFSKINETFSTRTVLILSLILSGAACLIISKSRNYYQAFWGLIIIGFSIGLFMAGANSLTLSKTKNRVRGRAVAVLNICSSIGPFFWLLVAHFMLGGVAEAQIFLLSGVVILVSAPIFGPWLPK